MNHRHFTALITEKLPQQVGCQLYMQKAEDKEWTVPKLRHILSEYISAIEMVGNESSNAPASGTNPSFTKQQNRPCNWGLLAGSHSKGPSQRESPCKEIKAKCV